MHNHRVLIVILVAVLMFFLPGGMQRAIAGTFTNCSSVTGIPPSECDALVALYNGTQGASWWAHDNWLVTDTPSDWYGVTVTSGHVTTISLFDNYLTGSLPAQLGNLAYLQNLWLTGNQLNGSIPPQLGSLTNLQTLELDVNQLSGSVPPELGNLTNLQTLYLYGNQLIGSIPLSFTALTHLTVFSDTGTYLCEPRDTDFQAWRFNVPSWTSPGLCYTISGHVNRPYGPLAGVTISAGVFSATSGADGAYTLVVLPDSYTLAPSLDDYSFTPPTYNVYISNDDVPGQDFLALHPFTNCASAPEIPAAECDALVALYNGANGAGWTKATNWLVTDTPSDWDGVTVTGGHVTALSLNGNQLNGSLPSQLGGLAGLQTLQLSDNQLSGGIPSQLGGLAGLQSLDLSSNKLSGGIPSQLGGLAGLQILQMSGNQLSGGIPSQLGGLANLQSLDLSSNPLGGSIPPQLGGLVNLQTLNLESDQLTGSIPPQLGSLTNLRSLILGVVSSGYSETSNNQLTGGIPPELGGLTGLQTLGLGSNQLSGSIPSSLGNLVHLEQLGLSHNQLGGSIPPQLSGLTNPFFYILDLSYNQLSGSIPAELGGMTNVQVLDLSHNQLTGSIPSQLNGMTSLYYLYLSFNQLGGSIPGGLASLPKLSTLVLSHNNLSEGIPPQLGGLATLNTLDLSFNGLTGSIPPQLGNLANLLKLNLSSNLLTGSMPSQLSAITNLHVLDISTNTLGLRIPLAYTYLTHLTTFNAGNTWVCVPQDSAFLAWVGTVGSWTSPGLCHTISGHVTKPGGAVPNVTIWAGAVHSTTSDTTGAFTLLDLPPASYTLTASLTGYTFIPGSLNVTITNADVTGADFHEVFSISGKITLGGKPLPGVTVADDSGHSAATEADGSYTLAGLVPGDYIVTPNLPGYTFSPLSRRVTITDANISGQDFSVIYNSYLPIVLNP